MCGIVYGTGICTGPVPRTADSTAHGTATTSATPAGTAMRRSGVRNAIAATSWPTTCTSPSTCPIASTTMLSEYRHRRLASSTICVRCHSRQHHTDTSISIA